MNGEVAHYNVNSTGDTIKDNSARIDAHRATLDEDYKTKTATWSANLTQYQSSCDQVTKIQNRLDTASRKMGASAFNTDGSLAYFVGYENMSHLRSPPDILRDIHRYLAHDMLRLRQSRIEILLQELCDSYDYEVASGRSDQPGVVTNLSASRSVLNLLTRRGGMTLTKSEIVRRLVSYRISKKEGFLQNYELLTKNI